MPTTSRITGMGELRRNLTRARAVPMAVLPPVMVKEQEITMAQAKEETPVDTGTLRASGAVYPPEIDPSKIEVVGGFGGAAADYAVPVHEKLDVSHEVGGPKFLERAFLPRVPDVIHSLMGALRAGLNRL